MEQTGRLSRQLGALLACGSGVGLSDGQLLERFLTRDGDAAESAFAVLVERHGPMVLRVCRGVLADRADADDAFQATFLVLVRKARGLWVQDSLGPWLHQVAVRTASHARAAALRRQGHEARAARPERQEPRAAFDDLTPILHEEIGRLPERYRAPVVLCDLQECSHDQAARHLGWPVGTVKSRLSRARERLRRRLLQRGLAPGVVAAAPARIGLVGDPLPAELFSLTSRAAVHLAGSRAMLAGSSAILAQGVLSAMNATRWWKLACALAVAGATITGSGLLAGRGTQAAGPAPQAGGQEKRTPQVKARAEVKTQPIPRSSSIEMPVAPVGAGPFRAVVSDPGNLEAAQSEDLVSRLEEPTTILSLVPEGTRVKKGDLVAELDSAALRDQLTNQRITTQTAEAAYQNAKLTREVAEIAVKEYEEGVFVADRASLQGEIGLARTAVEKANERADRLRQYQAKLNNLLDREQKLTAADIMAQVDLQDRLDAAVQAVLREKLALGKAQASLDRLERYTREKTLRELRSEVEKARSDELAKHLTWQLQQAKEAKLESQIRACKLLAPFDGLSVYVEGADRYGNMAERVRIEPGARVRVGQRIARIDNLDAPMRFNVHVGEPLVDRLEAGQKARVHIDAFPDQEFTGTVLSIAPRPDEGYWQRQQRKVYPTVVQLDGTRDTPLRPGMNGKAEITFAERDAALTVPFEAILAYQNKTQVAVKHPDGGFEWRDVVLGAGDPQTRRVEVKEGLQVWDQVALSPMDLLSEFDRRRKGITKTR